MADEFVYLAASAERRHSALRRTAGWMWAGGLASVVAVTFVPAWGGALCLVLAGLVVWKWRHGRRPERIVIGARDGVLTVASQALAERRSLSSLLQVELDTKSISKSYADKVVGTAIVSTGVQPAIDVSRIVLVFDDGDRVVLGGDFEASSEVTQWLGKLRVFLRKHGWVPEDERDPVSDDFSS